MEDYSWQIKCSSTLQSLTSSMASSSSPHHDLHTQMEGNAGYYPYPLEQHDLRRKVLGAVQDTLFPNYPNLGSEKSTQVGLGNSFLALLSGPASLLQCDSKLLSDANGIGGAMPSICNGIASEYVSEQNLQLGAYPCPSMSTRTVAGSAGFPVLQTTELESAVIHRMVTGSEKGKSSVSLSGVFHDSPHSSAKVQPSEIKSVEQSLSMSGQSPSLLGNCPRVFCLGTGGYLLISNTGLLGIVCSCHNLHMSVIKFCEHSGVCGGNAGDFVRMESGETIAMWRKLYFRKSGIRIPEDQSGWDWPECLTTTSGSVKSRTSVPNNSSRVSHLDHAFEGSLRPGQVSDGAILSHRNSVIDASLNKQKRNTCNGDNGPFKGLIGTSQNSMHGVPNSQIMVHPLSGFLTVPRSLGSGPQDDRQCTTAFTDTIMTNRAGQDLRAIAQTFDFSVCKGDPSILCPTMQDFRNVAQKSDISLCKSAPNSVFISSDTTFSNIELKLGQPYQSSQNSKTSDRPAFGQRPFESFENPSRLVFAQQMIHNSAGFRSKVELEKTLYTAAGQSNSSKGSVQSKLNLRNIGFGNSNVNSAATFSTGRISDHPQHYEPCFSKCDSSYVPSTSHPFFSSAQVSNGELHQLSSAPLEASFARRLSGNVVNVPSLGNNLPVDHVNHRLLTPNFGSQQVVPSQVFTNGVPLASSACFPNPIRALHKEEVGSSSTHMLNDNLRMLALRQILELSKQQHTSSAGINRRDGRCNGISYFHHPVVDSLDLEERLNSPGLAVSSEAGVRAYLAGATNSNSCCDLSTLIRGISIQAKESSVQGQLSSDPIPNEQVSMSRSLKDVSGSSEHEKCCRVPSACFQQGCNCSVYKCSERNLAIGGSSSYALQEQRENVNGASKLPRNQIGPNDEIPSIEQEATSNGNPTKNILSRASQWRDVPSKAKGISKAIWRDTPSKCYQKMHSYQEHGNSNISSGSSAPAITQLSVEVSNMDSSGDVAGNIGCVSNVVVDEGSGIDKCCSSDDAHGSEKSSEFNEKNAGHSISSLNSNHQSSRSLLEELKLINSLTWKKDQKPLHMEVTLPKKYNLSHKFARCLEKEKRKKDFSSIVHCYSDEGTSSADCLLSASKSVQMLSLPEANSSGHGFDTSSMKKPIRKRDIYKLYNNEGKDDRQPELTTSAGNCEIPEVSAGKKYKGDCSNNFDQSQIGAGDHGGTETMKNYTLLGCMKSSLNSQTRDYRHMPRPIVCGKYGELSNGEFRDMKKPAKIVPLSRVLKSARCDLPKNDNPTLSSTGELKTTDDDESADNYSGSYLLNNVKGARNQDDKMKNEASLGVMRNACSSKDNKFAVYSPILEVDKHRTSKKDCSEEDNGASTRLKSKTKETRKRSIYELTEDGKGHHHKMSSLPKTSKYVSDTMESKVVRKGDDIDHRICEVDEKTRQEQTRSSLLGTNSSCCVCSSSNKDESNCLLECKTCSIKVHQACYGVSRAPKGHWYCRPCRTSSSNIACVLCGYGGGAMTGALRSHTIVKSLLRVWNFETECKPKNVLLPVEKIENVQSRLNVSDSEREGNTSSAVFQSENTRPLASTEAKIEFPYQIDMVQNSVTKIKVDNSITAGLLNSTTKQWVHMVCGLWTPGTRCPNVDTMSTFDVSGAVRPRADVVCSFCDRPGGICIRCRILNCSVHFHPWCAHQKGLLHSEVEGVDNENIGFYGRCLLHATNPMSESDSDQADVVTGGSGIDELMCSRTEGYNSRKRDGFYHGYGYKSKRKFGCHVPQEQLNAWSYINGQKSGIRGIQKLPISDVEHDCRKEYARYKEGRGWKHLVVYKSGIHALGLYTSRFIYRSEMVVEYIGEIVGLRVSDKREKEYQSGKKLQYKSACYFFRLDKEHIIDATRKGGIARFVNHSCLPNCVAKVISVKNDKKVVFLAERDIFPGEEITYDYHFNHEDEGKKIPCFCNSRNCRRFLN